MKAFGMALIILIMMMSLTVGAHARVSRLTCDTMGGASLRSSVWLSHYSFDSSSSNGYELEVWARPRQETVSIQVTVRKDFWEEFSFSETVHLDDMPHRLFTRYVGDFWLTCEVR